MELIKPMLATLVAAPFHRPGWVYEEKYDGDRATAYRQRRQVRLVSRSLRDITAGFAELARAVERLGGADLVLDGEIVVFDERGVSRFQLLQRRALGEAGRPVFAAFDCLQRDGVSLLDRPLAQRRRALEAIVPAGDDLIMRSRRLPPDGLAAYRTAQRRGWEGIVAKDDASPYQPGRRSSSWLKVKARRQSEFVIGGFTAPKGQRPGLGALLVGLYDGARLRFTGKVGTGFSASTLADLEERLRPLRAAASPFEPAPRERDVSWVRPRLVAELVFAEWTDDGKLRQPVFLGLRHDKKPSDCQWAEREK
jgi:bifunctional non-homologous end joining protein LigD